MMCRTWTNPHRQRAVATAAEPVGADLDLRASDVERERVVAQLRDHAAEGRLDLAELDQRVERAYAARTRRELRELLADLPAPLAQHRSVDTPSLRARVVPYLAVMTLLVAIWLATGAGYPWPVWPALGWGVALLGHARGGVPGLPRPSGRI
jgi:hypothetical protein